MRATTPRARTTYKILAVALTGAPACARDVPTEPVPVVRIRGEEPAQVAIGEPPSADERPSAPPPRVARTMSTDPKLAALATELRAHSRAEVLASPDHYRPLCDAEGYPVVGNLMRKSVHQDYQPSTFCADIHEVAKR